MRNANGVGSDQKLIDAARKMLLEEGAAELRLRDVAKRAGVNSGLFHYHFGSKAEFKRRVYQQIYDDFFGRLSRESQREGSLRERLGKLLATFGRFTRDNRRIFVVLFGETLQGESTSTEYLQRNIPRHAALISGLILEGRRTGQFKKIPLPLAMTFAMGGIGWPSLLVGAQERFGHKLPFAKGVDSKFLLSDEAIRLRVELILDGLSARPVRKRTR